MSDSDHSAYQAAREQGQQVLVNTVLALASEMIAHEGTAALSMRKLAQATGCSTTVLYTLFGGKDGILNALFSEGFARLGAVHAQLGTTIDPRADIIALCLAYRRVALANPSHYAIMFGGSVDFTPSPASRDTALAAMHPLMQAIERARAAGVLVVDDTEAFGTMLWSMAHGFVSLELAGMTLAKDQAESLYTAAIERMLGTS
jgi:AcrR family transcriptional regulator